MINFDFNKSKFEQDRKHISIKEAYNVYTLDKDDIKKICHSDKFEAHTYITNKEKSSMLFPEKDVYVDEGFSERFPERSKPDGIDYIIYENNKEKCLGISPTIKCNLSQYNLKVGEIFIREEDGLPYKYLGTTDKTDYSDDKNPIPYVDIIDCCSIIRIDDKIPELNWETLNKEYDRIRKNDKYTYEEKRFSSLKLLHKRVELYLKTQYPKDYNLNIVPNMEQLVFEILKANIYNEYNKIDLEIIPPDMVNSVRDKYGKALGYCQECFWNDKEYEEAMREQEIEKMMLDPKYDWQEHI